MLGNALDFFSFFFDGSVYIIELTFSFIPEPFNYILFAFLTMFTILIAIKILRFAGDFISGIAGIFT